ncbi:recombinase family protein [Rothia dentocariosa]
MIHHLLAAGGRHTVGLRADGTVVAVERQREDCEKLTAFRGWEVVETYVDQSISASDKTKKYPAYLRMVQDYETGLIDAIVVYDLDRLTRRPRELEE